MGDEIHAVHDRESRERLRIYQQAEEQGMAIETNMSSQSITYNLVILTRDENHPIMLMEAAPFADIAAYLDANHPRGGNQMDLVTQYVAGLNAAIKAGSDVRTLLQGMYQAVIQIEIDEERKDLLVTFVNNRTPFDKTAHVPLRSRFTIEFTDYPNEIRNRGWQ